MFSISNKLFLALKHEAKIVEISRIYIAPIYVDNMKKTTLFYVVPYVCSVRTLWPYIILNKIAIQQMLYVEHTPSCYVILFLCQSIMRCYRFRHFLVYRYGAGTRLATSISSSTYLFFYQHKKSEWKYILSQRRSRNVYFVCP